MSEFFARLIELFGWPEFSLIELHQASTHLSIGLLLGGVLFDGSATLFKKPVLRETAFWAQTGGTILLLATFLLGYLGNPFAGKGSELGQKAELHFYFACATLVTFGVLALWRVLRLRRMAKIEMAVYGFLTLIGVALIAVVGWMGGHIIA